MIGHLSGTVIEAGDTYILLSVGGVGYKVHVTEASVRDASLSSTMSLYTHLAVRETALDLYGFPTRNELEFFELLIGISGIGPKVGLSILNAALPETLYMAIVNDDTSVLTKVSGIGKKNAQKIILELKNKIDKFSGTFEGSTQSTDDIELFETLEALGFDSRSIQELMQTDALRGLNITDKIKESIRLLGSK
jgi:Holliday junction DNA helicase RuvA